MQTVGGDGRAVVVNVGGDIGVMMVTMVDGIEEAKREE